jgi:RNA polymerase sigma-70 factor (ECF subfamily)
VALPSKSSPSSRAVEDLETTATLIARIREGDESATERLMRRYLPALRRWAHGRLPARARHLADTDDIVQITLLRTLKKVKEFEPKREGAFFAYLRRALQNQIRDQLRAAKRRPGNELEVEPIDAQASPLEVAIGRDRLRSYEEALAQLNPQQQEAVFLRVELGADYAEVADALGSPTPNAARMVIARALVRLAEEMNVDR